MENLIPTKATLQYLKYRRISAVNGHSLLKKKADALNAHYRRLYLQILQEQEKLAPLLRDAYFALTTAYRAAQTDLLPLLKANLTTTPKITTNALIYNVAGVRLPYIESMAPGQTLYLKYGSGSAEIYRAQQKWLETTQFLIKLAGMQASFSALQHVILQTNRRVNALEFVMIPRFDSQIKYIQDMLDEDEREGLFKMKMVSRKKEQEMDEQIFSYAEENVEEWKSGVIKHILPPSGITASPMADTAAHVELDDADNLFG